MRSLKSVLACLGGLLLLMSTAYGQFNLGTITGRVTDSSGAVIPGCKIVVQNVDTKAEQSTEGDAEGNYSIAALPSGHYIIIASKQGFEELRVRG